MDDISDGLRKRIKACSRVITEIEETDVLNKIMEVIETTFHPQDNKDTRHMIIRLIIAEKFIVEMKKNTFRTMLESFDKPLEPEESQMQRDRIKALYIEIWKQTEDYLNLRYENNPNVDMNLRLKEKR